MIDRGPWSVKGIDQRARAIARDAARSEGVTLGEYLNNLILSESHGDSQPNEIRVGESPASSSTLDQLARRVEAVEARSTLAITGIDQSVMGLVTRLQKAEDNNTVIAGHVDTFIEELRETHTALSEKVRQLEADDSAERNLDALKSLEEALGKLATHVYEEGEQAQMESDAIKGRVEAGFVDLTDRMERVETRVETTLTEAARRVEEAVEQAELRASEATRKLAGDVESKAAETDTRLSRMEDDVSGALGSMEQTLLRIQERLNRAESTTDAALQGLEGTFSTLDAKVAAIAEVAGPEASARLRAELEARFEGLAEELRNEITASRDAMAQEIAESGVAGVSTEVEALKAQIGESEARAASAFESIGKQVSRISDSFDKRLGDIEAGGGGVDTAAIDRVSEEVGRMAEQLEARVSRSENASARAIEQIGEQVSSVAQRLQGRQDEAFGRLSAHVEEVRSAQETRLSEALSNMSSRFESLHADTSAESLSPVQKAIASLASRLEVLEGTGAPAPVASGGVAQEADGADEDRDMLAAFSAAVQSVESDAEEAVSAKAVGENEAFQPGLPEWAVPETGESDADYTPGMPSEQIEPRGRRAEKDPLSALADWSGDQDELGVSEARDSDVFEEEPAGSDTPPGRSSGYPPAHLDLDVDMPRAAMTGGHEPNAREAARQADGSGNDAPASEALEEDLDASDYIARARKAALEAAKGDATPASRPGGRFAGRVPLYAAASMIVLAAAGTSGYLYLRGKQNPSGPVTVSTPVQIAPGGGGGGASSAADGNAASARLAAMAATAGLSGDAAEPDAVATPDVGDVDSLATASLPEPQAVAAIEPEPAEPVVRPTPAPAPRPQPEPQPVALPRTAAFDPIPEPLTLSRAAENGDRVASFQLGLQRLDNADYAAAADLIGESARKGLPVAQYRLAKLHEKGLGVARDLSAARRWTERAANGGNVRAMHDLAVFYADGEGGEQSYAKSVEWFRKAADFGVLDSQYNLAVLYQQGLGITKDVNEALFWFSLAAENGDPGAGDQVRNLLNEVDADTARTIRARVQAWRGARPNAPANGEFGRQPWEGGGQERVRAVQVALNALGFDVGSPDGIIGPATQDAIRAYQREAGLVETGTLSNAFVESLNARASGSAT